MIREPCRIPNCVAHFYAADDTLEWRRSSRKFFCAERRADQKHLTAMKIYRVRCRSTHWQTSRRSGWNGNWLENSNRGRFFTCRMSTHLTAVSIALEIRCSSEMK